VQIRNGSACHELPERVPNRALYAFVKSLAVCCGAPGR
jgi:hypothetical protein